MDELLVKLTITVDKHHIQYGLWNDPEYNPICMAANDVSGSSKPAIISNDYLIVIYENYVVYFLLTEEMKLFNYLWSHAGAWVLIPPYTFEVYGTKQLSLLGARRQRLKR